jgi:DNA invertase Pin-like site-specific DNA recombinase
MTNTRVYSYRRFSSGRQASGHSLERQTASARAWCVESGYILDEDFVLADLGISAYTGKNATEGALAAFLLAAKEGKIPRGSILLVESLDRLSRSAITDAVALLTSIVRAGIRVVSLIDGKEWNETTINDTVNFIMSVLLFARAHEESATKAKRVKAAFTKKREANLPVVTCGHGPGWASASEDMQSWVLDNEKAGSVRKVFQKVAEGMGGIRIARLANEEGWPLPFRVRANTNTRWEHTQISRLIKDRRTLGEWQPKEMVDGKLVPLGDPVINYFPQVISDELWGKVHAALNGRHTIPRLRGIKGDIFAGLFYCKCGERMDKKAASTRGQPRYYCLGRIAGVSECAPISEAAIVEHGIPFLGTLESGQFQETEALRLIKDEIDVATSKLADLDEKAERYLDAIEEGGESKLLTQRLRAIEKEQATLHRVIDEKRIELGNASRGGTDFGALLKDDVKAAVLDKEAVKERHRISTALHRLLEKIVWDPSGWIRFYTKDGNMFASRIPPEALKRAPWGHSRTRKVGVI